MIMLLTVSDEGAESQKDEVSCPRSHSEQLVEPKSSQKRLAPVPCINHLAESWPQPACLRFGVHSLLMHAAPLNLSMEFPFLDSPLLSIYWVIV